MQTRRDQLQAYRFQNRRALAALVTGEPNVLEAPMRRLTTTTVSGIMIAILVAAIFALIGLLKPASGDKWRDAGAIIVDKNSPSIYVLLSDGKLHPVVNYASAVLAVEGKADPHVEYVEDGDIKGVQRGSTIGITGLPYSLPGKGDLIRSPWSVCSIEQPSGANLQATVTVHVGTATGATALDGGKAVLARSVGGGSTFVLDGGTRYPVGSSGRIAASLGLQSATPVTLGTAFLNALPAGPPLATPAIPQAGAPITGYTVGGKVARVGQLIDVDNGAADLVALPDGVAALTKVEAALVATVQVGSQPLQAIEITKSDQVALADHESTAGWNAVKGQFAGLPQSLPAFATQPAANGGLCATYHGSSTEPTFSAPGTPLSGYTNPTVIESDLSAHGRADSVSIQPGGAALVRSSGSTVYVVAAPGKRYAAASTAVLKGFGYGSVTPSHLDVHLLPLIPQGPAFDPSAALQPPVG